VNIHETKIDAVKFSKRHSNICRNFRKPNQLQTANKETYTKLQHNHHKHQGLGHLTRSISTVTDALASVSSFSQLFSFLVECSVMILKGFIVVGTEGTGSYTCKTAIF
jgi:hypothetical protein